MPPPLLSVRDISKYYINGQNVVAGLNKVSISFDRGEFVAITGESGSGKSTFAHILGGVLPYEDGELLFEGDPTSHYDSADWEAYRSGCVASISQSYDILSGISVEENVVSILRLSGFCDEEAKKEAESILREVELWQLRSRRAAKLSSGQKQRLSIARALAKPCSVLIADEPTGNLDPENSDKVMRLLAKAAKDRLVLLVTHEFSEAEPYVTRHISLEDGRICADAKLRPVAVAAPSPAEKRTPKDLSAYIAALQLRSRPVWSWIVLFFLLLTAFTVFAFTGSFIIALDDTSTRIYESDAFLNGEKTRIVAVRQDRKVMTENDYDTILSLSHVRSLDKFGYIQDISYAYEEGIDYKINYPRYNYGTFREAKYIEVPTVEFLTTEQYMKTVPLNADNKPFLTAGALPSRFDQVIAVGDEKMIGKTVTVYLRNVPLWDMGGYIAGEFTIVGVTDQGNGLYFHDDVARALTLDYLGSDCIYMPFFGKVPSKAEFINYRDARSKVMYGQFCMPFYAVCTKTADAVMRDLHDSEVLVSLNAYVELLEKDPTADYSRIYARGYASEYGTWNVAGLNASTAGNVLSVSPAFFQELLERSGIGNSDQVSLTITDYAYTQRVLRDLEKAGYYALSPYVLGSARVDPELAAQRVQTLLICMISIVFILALQLIVLRAMFSVETDDYRILSDMGLSRKFAQKSVYWQILAFTVAAQTLGILGIFLCGQAGVPMIGELTKYLHGIWWLLISAIHLLSTLAAAWVIANAMCKRIYPRKAAVQDLNFDVEEAAV